jgi:hypothetical protein
MVKQRGGGFNMLKGSVLAVVIIVAIVLAVLGGMGYFNKKNSSSGSNDTSTSLNSCSIVPRIENVNTSIPGIVEINITAPLPTIWSCGPNSGFDVFFSFNGSRPGIQLSASAYAQGKTIRICTPEGCGGLNLPKQTYTGKVSLWNEKTQKSSNELPFTFVVN